MLKNVYQLITIKIPYIVNDIDKIKISEIRRQFSIVIRYSYNRFTEGLNEKEIRKSLFKLNGINIDAWIKQSAILEAKYLYKITKGNKKIIFGGKKNFYNRMKNKISINNFKEKRFSDITIQGEKACKGNRKFNLDINNNSIVFKIDRLNHVLLKLPKLRNNYKKILNKLQEMNKLDGHTYSVKLNDNYIFLTFDKIDNVDFNKNEDRYIGIDMNPKNIGFSIFNKNEIIKTGCFDFYDIIDKIQHLKKSNTSKEYKYYQNKLNFELIEISKKISTLSITYRCKFIFIEELKFDKFSKNKKINRLVNNLWKKNIFIDNLKKRSVMSGQKLFKVNPVYSSIIGNCIYDYADPINSSIEIARRGYNIIILKNKRFYPTFEIKKSLIHQWKEMIRDMPDNWEKLFVVLKNSKLKYRVPIDSIVFREYKTKKSHLKIFLF